jgi:hypothetical protein
MIAIGIVLCMIGIRIFIDGSFCGNLFRFTRESMPYTFYSAVAINLIIGIMMVVVGCGLILRHALE